VLAAARVTAQDALILPRHAHHPCQTHPDKIRPTSVGPRDGASVGSGSAKISLEAVPSGGARLRGLPSSEFASRLFTPLSRVESPEDGRQESQIDVHLMAPMLSPPRTCSRRTGPDILHAGDNRRERISADMHR